MAKAESAQSGQSDRAAKKEQKRAKKAAKAGSPSRVAQIFEAFKMQRREDKLLVPLMLAAFLGVTAVAMAIGFVFGVHWYALPIGLALGLMGAVIIFGRRVQSTVYRKAAGQPGAAGWALENLRGRWKLTQAVAGTTQLDAVHRVIGKPGIVLVGEGADSRVKSLLSQEKKRVSRLVGDTPIYEIIVGDAEGQVPLSKLQSKLMKLPRNINSGQIDSLENRLAALASRSNSNQPKGPLPQGTKVREAKMRTIQRAAKRR